MSKHPWIKIPNEVPEYLVASKIEYRLVWIGAGRREWDDEWHNEDERPQGDAITDTEMNQFPAVSAVLFSLSLNEISPLLFLLNTQWLKMENFKR